MIPSTEDQNDIMKAARIVCIILTVIAVPTSAESISYTVAEKDTLWSISQRYNIGVEELKEINNIADERNLRVGMTLLIPTAYTVEKGDNLWKIAREHQTSVKILRELNDLENDEIHIGDVLLIPLVRQQDEVETGNVEIAVAESKDSALEAGDNVSEDPNDFWPVNGVRKKKTGKISGTEILGAEGDAVISIADGEVVWNSTSPVFGNVIIIESAANYLYLYSGLTNTLVNFGDKISAGKKIAELGVNPHTGEAKLLFSVYKDGRIIEPSLAPRG